MSETVNVIICYVPIPFEHVRERENDNVSKTIFQSSSDENSRTSNEAEAEDTGFSILRNGANGLNILLVDAERPRSGREVARKERKKKERRKRKRKRKEKEKKRKRKEKEKKTRVGTTGVDFGRLGRSHTDPWECDMFSLGLVMRSAGD